MLSGAPTYRIVSKYRKYYTVQNDSDLAGSVSMYWRSQYAMEHRTNTAVDLSTLALYRDAKELQIERCFHDPGANVQEDTRLLNLLKVRRTVYDATVYLDEDLLDTLDIGKVVNLKFPRYGLTAGKLVVITGLTVNLQKRSAELTLWG